MTGADDVAFWADSTVSVAVRIVARTIAGFIAASKSHRIRRMKAWIFLSLMTMAQWPAYPSKSVPRTADGKVNFDAAPPRTADGHIDFTGTYENLWFYQGRIGRPPASPPR